MPAEPFNSRPPGNTTRRPSGDTRRRFQEMGIGVSLILIAVGAILTWAVETTVSGVDINTVGVILMIVGGVAPLLSLMFWSRGGGYGVAGDGSRRRVTRVEEDAPPPGY